MLECTLHSFNQQILTEYYVSELFLSVVYTVVKKTKTKADKISALIESL